MDAETIGTLIRVIIMISCALITTFLLPYIKERIDASKYERALNMIESAVHAYEQTLGRYKGQIKKSEVIKFCEEWLKENGVKISDKSLDILVESFVFSMNERKETDK